MLTAEMVQKIVDIHFPKICEDLKAHVPTDLQVLMKKDRVLEITKDFIEGHCPLDLPDFDSPIYGIEGPRHLRLYYRHRSPNSIFFIIREYLLRNSWEHDEFFLTACFGPSLEDFKTEYVERRQAEIDQALKDYIAIMKRVHSQLLKMSQGMYKDYLRIRDTMRDLGIPSRY